MENYNARQKNHDRDDERYAEPEVALGLKLVWVVWIHDNPAGKTLRVRLSVFGNRRRFAFRILMNGLFAASTWATRATTRRLS